MSVKTLESYQEFTADGSTTYFTFNFNYVDSSEIVVGMRTGDNQYTVVDPVSYVLTKNASTDGGKIRFVTTKPCENPDDPTCGDYIDNPPPAGTIVRIERKTVQSSTADWYVGLDMKALVGLFDKLIRITQENTDKFKNTIQTFPTQQGITVRELLSEHDKKIFYWNNVKQWLDITDFTIDDVIKQTDVGDILEQANAYSDEKNAVLESKIDGKLTAVNAQIDANADAIQKTREDYINADSEIHQILNNHADELTTLRGNQASLGDQVSGIEEKIPGSASSANQLATKQDLANVKVDLTGYATETYVNTREQKIRDDVNAEDSRLQSQITAQAAEIATKQDKLIAGDNITIVDNVISATGGGGGGGGGIANVIHDATLTGSGTNASPLGLAEAIKDEIADKAPKETVEALTQIINGIIGDYVKKSGDTMLGGLTLPELTVRTAEGEFYVSVVAGVVTIATNNGLDFASHVKFDHAPTTDDNTTWENALGVSLVRKAQVATVANQLRTDQDVLYGHLLTLRDMLNVKDEEGEWVKLTTEAQEAIPAINELNAKIGEGGTKVIIKRYE